MHSSGFFRIKLIARLILKCEILGSHTISDQSLLLSTIVLNDIYIYTVYIYIYIYIYIYVYLDLTVHHIQLLREQCIDIEDACCTGPQLTME